MKIIISFDKREVFLFYCSYLLCIFSGFSGLLFHLSFLKIKLLQPLVITGSIEVSSKKF